MADETAELVTESETKKEKKGKGNLVPALIVGVAILVGAKMFGGGGGGAAAAPVHAETTATTVAPGPVIKLDPITLNMADGRFLKIAMALQLAGGDHGEAGGGGHGEATEEADPSTTYAAVLDAAITLLSERDYEDLVTAAGKQEAKAELLHAVQEHFVDVEDILFLSLVMQ